MSKTHNQRLIILLALLGLLTCILAACYFLYARQDTTLNPQAQLDALLNRQEPSSPSPEPERPGESTALKPDPAAGIPKADMTKTAFESKLAESTSMDKEKEDAANKREKDYIPPPRLAPDMFAFESVPFDAPIAKFPLVLVGQKDLEWYPSRVRRETGGIEGGGGSPSFYRNSPNRPPTPTPPPGPRPPPGKPPKPPPEVSNSGL